MAKHHKLIFLLATLAPFLSLAASHDFCIADLPAGNTPNSYPCKHPAEVTADDFYYKGLGGSGMPLGPSKIAIGSAFVTTFPTVNGLGMSLVRMDIAPGGAAPIHSHPGGSELVYVLEGSVVSSFISATLSPSLL